MNRAPKIGQRVRYRGSLAVGPCVGVVHAVYPAEVWTDDEDDPRPTGRMKPQRDWSVGITVDGDTPTPWGYGERRTFAAEVSKLEPAPSRVESQST